MESVRVWLRLRYKWHHANMKSYNLKGWAWGIIMMAQDHEEGGLILIAKIDVNKI